MLSFVMIRGSTASVLQVPYMCMYIQVTCSLSLKESVFQKHNLFSLMSFSFSFWNDFHQYENVTKYQWRTLDINLLGCVWKVLQFQGKIWKTSGFFTFFIMLTVKHSLKDKSLLHFFVLQRFLVAGDHTHSLLVRQIDEDSNTFPWGTMYNQYNVQENKSFAKNVPVYVV